MKFNLINHYLLLYLSFAPIINTAQTANYNNHYKKYWYFKSRLNNDFTKVGTGDGESLLFNQRGNTNSTFNATNAELNTGDAAATLGYYIAVLATEYKLLQISNQSTAKIKHELFCALNAINRLDYKAEGVFQAGAENLNGFFIRDDIPSSLLQSTSGYEHFNYYNTGGIANNSNNRGFMSNFSCGANFIESDWIKRVEDVTNHQIEESQDQAYNILFGLAFVNKFVPISETDNGNVFGYGSGETSLTKEARNITNRILSHIRNPKDLNGNSCGNPGNTFPNNWRIRNPTTCNLVSAGDNAEAFAYALGEAQCFINGGSTFGNGTINSPPNPLISCPGDGYHNGFSQTVGRVIWEGAVDTYIGIPNCPNVGIDNRVFVTNLLSICNCAYGNILENAVNETQYVLAQIPVIGNILANILGFIWQWVQVIVTNYIPYITNNTWSDILLNAYSPGSSLDHGPLARKVLHGGIYQPNGNYSIDYQLDQAPCSNIYNLGNGLNSGLYWRSDNRLDHPNRSNLSASIPGNALCTGVDLFKGEYNGIDFLLYHNLWYLHQWQQNNNLLNSFIDLSDVYVNQNGGTISSTTNPFKNIIAYETMKVENTKFLYDNIAPTYWRTGKTIYLGPGTEILPNSNLHAYIQKFDCATDLGQFRQMNGDSVANDIVIEPYHYVAYPNYDNTTSSSTTGINNQNYITELLDVDEEVSNDKGTVESGGFEVHPNPSNNNAKIYLTLQKNETATIIVKDITGKVVLEKTNLSNENNGDELDLLNLAMGSYFISFSSTRGIIKTVKLIKTN